MSHVAHSHGSGHRKSLNRSAIRATAHCLTGCAIGEVLGMLIATALGWQNTASIAISVALAFVFGYALTLGPILGAGVPYRTAVALTVASDTTSIATMELIDTSFCSSFPARWPPASPMGSSGGALHSASRSPSSSPFP
jgi:hypothetical protein